MEGFLGFVSVFLFAMFWSTNRDYKTLKKEVGKVDDYLERRTKSLEQIYNYRNRTLDEKEARIEQLSEQRKLEIYQNSVKAILREQQSEKKIQLQQRELEQRRALLNQFLTSKIADFPVVATIIADYEEARDRCIVESLERKNDLQNPPLKSGSIFAKKSVRSSKKAKPISGNWNTSETCFHGFLSSKTNR